MDKIHSAFLIHHSSFQITNSPPKNKNKNLFFVWSGCIKRDLYSRATDDHGHQVKGWKQNAMNQYLEDRKRSAVCGDAKSVHRVLMGSANGSSVCAELNLESVFRPMGCTRAGPSLLAQLLGQA